MTQTVGLHPAIWGCASWLMLHSIAIAYVPTQENKVNYYAFFANLGSVLPCELCSKHYQENFDPLGLKMALEQPALAEKGLFRWVYDLHNTVNQSLKIPQDQWPTYAEVVKKYEGYKSDCSSTPGVCGAVEGVKPQKRIRVVEEFDGLNASPLNMGLILVIVVLLCVIMYLYFKKKSKGER